MRAAKPAALAAAALVLLLVLGSRGGVPTVPDPARAGSASATGLDANGRLGTWVDIYDLAQWRHPERTVRGMDRRGVGTLYLETSNFRRKGAFVHPRGTRRLLNAAHERDVAVVAWYLPGFDDLDRDLARSIKAIRYETGAGERFDSFGLDIESTEVRNDGRRTRRLLRLSEMIRDGAGPAYTLSAIIPSPVGMERLPNYWRGFPFADLPDHYDAILPMSYFTFRVRGADRAQRYCEDNVRIIREETGDPEVPIHVIGGLSGDATTGETRGFVRAVRGADALGGSFYDFEGTRPSQWDELGAIA